MGKDQQRAKEATNLTTFMLSQDFLPEHWNWSFQEKAALGSSVADTAKVIYDRLVDAGIEIVEAYAIMHDMDEHIIWDEYVNQYRMSFTSHHIHFTARLKKGATLETIANVIGVSLKFIEKPKSGRYSYDNMLSYLIHIKYPKKYQYNPQSVLTICGKLYIEYFREKHEQWMHGRAERILRDIQIEYNDLKIMIMEGKITFHEVYMDPKYNYALHQHYDAICRLFGAHNTIDEYRKNHA